MSREVKLTSTVLIFRLHNLGSYECINLWFNQSLTLKSASLIKKLYDFDWNLCLDRRFEDPNAALTSSNAPLTFPLQPFIDCLQIQLSKNDIHRTLVQHKNRPANVTVYRI